MWLSVRDKAKQTGDNDAEQQAETQLKNIQDELDKLMDFRKKLKKYCTAYDYISQIVNLGDPDLEVFRSFAKLLSKKLDGISVDEIDISSLVLSDYKIAAVTTPVPDPNDEPTLKPMTAGGKGHSNRKESLRAIVVRINEIWGLRLPAPVQSMLLPTMWPLMMLHAFRSRTRRTSRRQLSQTAVWKASFALLRLH